jgi:hypothetical protein
MLRPWKLIFCTVLAIALLVAPAHCYGTGVRAYVPTLRSAVADKLPFAYDSSFMVYNDGYRDGVYIIRVGVTEPSSINWLNLSEAVFTLKPGGSRLVHFRFNVTAEQALNGDHEFIFTPTLLTPNVEPYLDQFANYVSAADSFRFRLNVTGGHAATSAGLPIVFVKNDQTNFAQYSVLKDTGQVVTMLDRAIKLNLPDKAIVGQSVPVSTSVFEGLSNRGISLMAVSPEGSVYPISEGNYTFSTIGLWGVVVLVGDEIVLGRTVDVAAVQSPLAGIDIGTILGGISLLVLLSAVPLWLMASGKTTTDPYEDIIYKAGVIGKYIDRFDKDRLQRAVKILKDEYDGLARSRGKGKKVKAREAIDELSTLSSFI